MFYIYFPVIFVISGIPERIQVSLVTIFLKISRPSAPTIASILGNVDQWYQKAPSSSLSTSIKYALLKRLYKMYIGMYSWLVELKEGNEVVGLLSKVCRENFGTGVSNM